MHHHDKFKLNPQIISIPPAKYLSTNHVARPKPLSKNIFHCAATNMSEKVNYLRYTTADEWSKWLYKVNAFYHLPRVSPIMVKKSLDNRPHVAIRIGDIEVTALIDTGATNSILGAEGWRLLSDRFRQCMTHSDVPHVNVANGSSNKVIGVVPLEITLDSVTRTINFLVVPTLAYSHVLGADFCDAFKLSMHFRDFSFQLPRGGVVSAVEGVSRRDCLSVKQTELLDNVIEKFRELSTTEMGCVTTAVHRIDTGDSAPIKQRQYALSPAMQKHLHAEIKKMADLGVIQPSNSPWSSPVLLVKKKNGEFRACFDGRRLNSVTVPDSYPLPRTDSILNRLRNAKFLSSIDLRKAFWQIPLEESSRPKTAFCVPGLGLQEFRVMPFGLSNSAQTLQRAMEKTLGPVLHKEEAFVYLDDIIIPSPTFEQHISTLEEIYECLKKAGFRVNLDKCEFCCSSLSFLGFIVDQHGLRTDPAKVEAIQRFRTPKTTTEVKRLIGLVSYYRIFLPNLATISAPITALIKNKKKGQPINWTSEAEVAFEKIKQLISNAPVLISPNFDEPFFIQTDASAVALGAVLFQERNGREHPVAYASRALTTAEQKYSATERELLGIIFGIEKFRGYIEGTQFTVITDCAALTWLHKLNQPTGRLARWALRLSQFTFEVKHRPGKLNIVPDFLSRNVAAINIPNLTPDQWYLNMVNKVVENPENFPHFRVNEGRLYKHIPSAVPNIPEWKLVIPTVNREEVLKACHDMATSAHMGVSKTYAKISELYYWPHMKNTVTRYIRNCLVCGAQKSSQEARPGFMGQYKKISYPFQLISLDLLGSLPRSKKGNQYLLVVTDWFTKFVLIHPLRNANAASIVKFIENHVFLMFGVPQIVLCDNGVQFISKEFKKLMSDYKVQKIWYNAKYHPQVNPTERVNRVLITAISSYIKKDHTTWDENVYKIAYAIRSAKHEVTNFSPNFLTFGRYVPLDGSFFGPVPNEQDTIQLDDRIRWDKDQQDLPNIFKEVRVNLLRSYEKSQSQYNLRKRPCEYNVGDRVWKKNHFLSDAAKKFSTKLAPKYMLCIVTNKVSPLVYELQDLEGKNQGRWHVKDLKTFSGETPDHED